MNKEELLKKIKALAENGIAGEKENAQKLLNKLMRKYNINEEEIEEDAIKEFYFKMPRFYKSGELANQILYSIVGKEINVTRGIYQWRARRKLFIRCTSAEFLEFEAKFKFYSHHFKKEVERFYSAFVQANKIFPPVSKSKESDFEGSLTEEDFKVLLLAKNLEKHDYRLQLTNGET